MTITASTYARESDGRPILVESYVLFIDVLGVKCLARQPDAADTLVRLDAAVARGRELSTDRASRPWWTASWFSDSLCLCAPIRPVNEFEEGEPELGAFLGTTSAVQFELALAGFFMRGGASLGLQFSDENMTFGPALIEAVEMERQIGQPCVGLDESVVARARGHLRFYGNPFESPQNHDIRLSDGAPFVNYLEAAYNYVGESLREDLSMVLAHRDNVRKSLATGFPPKTHSKYEWLADYHNDFCRRNDLEDCCVEEAPASHEFVDFATLA